MDEQHDARRDFNKGAMRAPLEQTPEYRGEMERLQRGQRPLDMSGPLPPGYGDGDPRVTLAVLGLYVAAVVALGGMALSGMAQVMAIGWLALLLAVLLVPAILFSSLTRGFTKLEGSAAKAARRDAFLLLLLCFGAGRLLGGGVLIGQVAPFVASAALLFVILGKRLPAPAVPVMALANPAGVLLAGGIARSLLYPLLVTVGG
ncbi:hypothetical protein P6144_15465 [Sphingomonas sp. HITSZ_GF]|uniref:hypothetical protein n=1 Tax=Sphingomonas sp. HITSZ_GF TaxID=3037247 RepID=UPI00240E113A|nr:hypothetical protein [Sphingomonas sp. HITSZ_GF]MDG2535058.1 hypothetical protein [Sphingomonas sp. HITSZ_GF]